MCGYYFLLRFVDLSGPVCLWFFLLHSIILSFFIEYWRQFEFQSEFGITEKNPAQMEKKKKVGRCVLSVCVMHLYKHKIRYHTLPQQSGKKAENLWCCCCCCWWVNPKQSECRTIIEICMIQGQTILLNKLILISRKKLPRLPSPSRSYSAKSREKTHHHRQRLSTNNNTSNNAQFRTRILKSKWTITGCFWCFAAICLARFFVQPLILTRFEYNANSIAIKILMAAFKKSRLRWGIMGFICERRAGRKSTNERSNNRHNHTHTLLLNAFPLTFWSEAWHNVCVFFSAALSKWNSAISHTNRVSVLRRVLNVCPLVNKLINILHSVAHNIAFRWRFRIITCIFSWLKWLIGSAKEGREKGQPNTHNSGKKTASSNFVFNVLHA